MLRLCDVASMEGGGTPSRAVASYFGGAIPWVTPSDLNPIGYVTSLGETPQTLTSEGLANSSAKLIPPGSVLFSSRATIGKIGITKVPCATNQGFVNFTPRAGVIDVDYLVFLLLRFTNEIKLLAGQTTFLEVPRGKLKEFQVPVPPLAHQRRIVGRIKECLERVEEIDHLRDEARSESRYLAPALYEAIEHRADWPMHSVGDVILGSSNGRSIAQNNTSPTGYVLSLRSVHDVVLDMECRKPIQLPKDIAKHFRIEAGDVFVSRANTRELVGLASVAAESPVGVIYPDLLIKLVVDPKIMRPSFMAYALRTRSSRSQIQARAVGTSQSMVKISGERLKDVKVRVPPLSRQDELLVELDECREIAATVSAEFQEDPVAPLRDSILRKAFAGEM